MELVADQVSVPIVLDGVHALAVENQPLERVCATFVAGTHKWLGGLQERGIRASVTPYRQQYVRLGTSLHVDAKDVDAAVGSVKALRG